MDLSRNIIKKYVEVATPVEVTENDKTSFGTIVGEGDELYVKLDGSDALTPISSTIDVRDGDRVLVLIKNHEAMVLGSPTSPTARLEELRALEGDVTEFGVILADKVGTGELVAMQALIDELTASDVEITGKLEANDAKIETLEAENATINGKLDVYQADIEELEATKIDATAVEAKYATIASLEAVDLDVTNLEASYGEFTSATIERLDAYDAKIDNLDATYATVEQLEVEQGRIDTLESTSLTAESAEIKNLQSEVADIDTLIFGSASGTTIQTSFANAVIAQLGNAQIKSAMIESLAADKIAAGDIITNNVRVLSEDGKLLISDETIQISDDTRVRVQIGKDASNDYSVNVWDADGKLMFSAGGITDAAIKDAIIRDDMVSDNANIKASKLDISSLFTEINNSTETINSNKVLIDTDAGTLDVAFTKMTSDIDDISDTVTTQGTALSVVQSQISSKVWQSDIDTATKDLATEASVTTLSDQYSTLNQTVSGISATVGQHTTQIANKADNSAVTAVSDRVTEVEADLDGFRTEVSNTYQTIDDMSGYSTTEQMNSAINQKAGEITQSVSANYQTKGDYPTTTQMNSAINQKAGEITSTVESLQSDLETNYATKSYVTQTAESITSRVEGAEGEISTLKQTAQGLTSTVASIQDDIGSLDDRVGTTESSITQHADLISQKVSSSEFSTYQNTVSSTYATKTELNKKAADYSIELYNGTGGNPKPVRFATVDYSTCNSENGVSAKICMISGHGNGVSYVFMQDAIINVAFNGTVTVDVFKHYGAETPTYDDAVRQYGDVFWVNDTTNKVVDFYCLMGQYARLNMTPWKRTTYSSKGTVTQYTSATIYSSGTKEWANNSDIALMADVNVVKNTVAEHTTNIDNITSRVETTEQSITTINGNVTSLTDRMSAAEQKITDEAIISTVSSTYATKSALAATDTKASNAATAAANAQSDIDNLEIGGRNLWINTSRYRVDTPFETTSTSADNYINSFDDICIYCPTPFEAGDIITVQGKSNLPWSNVHGSGADGKAGFWLYLGTLAQVSTGQYISPVFLDGDNASTEFVKTYTVPTVSGITDIYIGFRFNTYSASGASLTGQLWDVKLERGNKVTDWTPAPEDVDAAVSNAQTTADAASEVTDVLVGNMETILGDGTIDNQGLIAELSSEISQTNTNWSAAFNSTTSSINNVNDKVDKAQKDISSYSTWFTMDENAFTISKTVNGEVQPLKVQLDNDSLDFLDGNTVVAYVKNDKMRINAAEVEGTLDVGSFRWTARNNGNMGLMWIGG